MTDENKTAMVLLVVVATILGWVLARAVSVVDNKPDCERYWQQMSVYLQTENEDDMPDFIRECATVLPIE
jgi:hypothetical protein